MAVIQAKLIDCSTLYKCVGLYGTADILNGGETYNEDVIVPYYTFKISGLEGHTTKNIIVKSLLLNADGSLSTTKKFKLTLNNTNTSVNLTSSDSVKTIVPTAFSWNLEIDSDLELNISAENLSKESCYFGLQSILINLLDVNLTVLLTFTGPLNQRKPSNIIVASLVLNRDATPITFSKDPSSEYDSSVDNVDGRAYFKKNGIFVDGYLYSINLDATETIKGVVKLSSNSFELDAQGIIAPIDSGVAATPQLVYNTLASAINYTNEKITPIEEQVVGILAILNGIEAPLIINIENEEGEKESLGEELTFSNDFESLDNKLYIKWIEIS